jgi:hypothetical protein
MAIGNRTPLFSGAPAVSTGGYAGSTLALPKTLLQKSVAVVAGAAEPTADTMVPVADADIAALTRWYSNVLGPAKSPGAPLTQTKKGVYDRFKTARARISALLQKDGTKPAIRNFSEAMWRQWRSLDTDGQAAFDKMVVGLAPTRDPKSNRLSAAPKGYSDWFSQQVSVGRNSGLDATRAIAFAAARHMDQGTRNRVFGFDIPAHVVATFTVPTVKPTHGTPYQPVTIAPGARGLLPGAGPVGPEPLLPYPDIDQGLERGRTLLRNTGLSAAGGAVVGGVGAHLLKKSKGWGAVIGAVAGIGFGIIVLPNFTNGGE